MRRAVTWTACALAVAAAAGGTLPAPPARADADPASDVLPIQDVFFPYVGVSNGVARRLEQTVARAKREGFPVKVALIAAPNDLGGVPNFFNRPIEYARFLGAELDGSLNRKVPLMVASYAGYGTSNIAARAATALEGLDVSKLNGADDLANAAVDAVAGMAKAAGHPFAVPKAPPAGAGGGGKARKRGRGSGGTSPALIFAPALAIVLGMVAVGAVRRRRRAPESEGADPEAGSNGEEDA